MLENEGRLRFLRRSSDPRRNKLRRGVYLLPSMFTIGNMFCGYACIVYSMSGKLEQAAPFIGIAIVLDMLDGRIARLTHTSSEFGVQLDSIADVLTFGIAPAILALSWGQTKLPSVHLHQWSWIVTFIFLICGAWRLARFNVQTQKPLDTAAKRNFIGLPIPAGAGLIAAVVHFFKSPIEQATPSVSWYLLVLLTGFLMASTFRYPSFKELQFLKRGSRLTLLATATLIGAIYFYSEVTLLLIAVAYVSSGLVMRTMRRFTPAVPALGDPAHGNIKT